MLFSAALALAPRVGALLATLDDGGEEEDGTNPIPRRTRALGGAAGATAAVDAVPSAAAAAAARAEGRAADPDRADAAAAAVRRRRSALSAFAAAARSAALRCAAPPALGTDAAAAAAAGARVLLGCDSADKRDGGAGLGAVAPSREARRAPPLVLIAELPPPLLLPPLLPIAALPAPVPRLPLRVTVSRPEMRAAVASRPRWRAPSLCLLSRARSSSSEVRFFFLRLAPTVAALVSASMSLAGGLALASLPRLLLLLADPASEGRFLPRRAGAESSARRGSWAGCATLNQSSM